MFLPSQLPKKVRRKSETESGGKMGGKGKKARAADQDEMLGPSSPMASHQPSTSAHQSHPPGFVARSWARISGRRRRQKRRMAMEERRQERLATTLTMADPPAPNGQNQQGTWPTMMERGGAGGNLAGLAHLEEEEERRKRHFIGRGMDRLRRSIRRSLHKGSQSGQVLTNSPADGQPSSSAGQSSRFPKNYCHSDEIAVRSAACSFPIKYLGACEVFESRGMSVCESALQHLRTRKRTVKALLYVSGDGIRVVDQENNRGLIVDQTIEKVSFCSPDRHNDRGFAYICRDGATRRWMCHGFHSSKDSGERLSHAVGCAFTVCLEKKRKRDAETAAYKSAQALANSLSKGDQMGSQNEFQMPPEGITNEEFARTNQAYRSFRQLSISERRADPQKAILVEHIRSQSSLDSTVATPRPTANPALFERTGSLRAPILSSSSSNPASASKSAAPSLNRFNSLQHGNFDSRTSLPRMSLHNEPIWEGEGEKEAQTFGNNPHWPTTGSNRFYQTLPHSMPNFGQGGINNSWANVIPPPTILEEDKQPAQSAEETEDNNSSPPADPFTSNERNIEPQQKFRADNWLEQTLQKASSSTLPRSATMNWPPAPKQNWAQFPQSQSFQSASDWPNGSSSNCPPAQPPPPLPSWTNSTGQSNPLPNLAPTLRMPKPNGQRGQDETDQSIGPKNHSRKASGNRRIGYQLLQETDVSVSPPKNESILGRAIGQNGNGEKGTAIDPFDVNWSQQVLKETAKQHQNGNGKKGENGGGEAEKNNPFGWDLSSPPVNV